MIEVDVGLLMSLLDLIHDLGSRSLYVSTDEVNLGLGRWVGDGLDLVDGHVHGGKLIGMYLISGVRESGLELAFLRGSTRNKAYSS